MGVPIVYWLPDVSGFRWVVRCLVGKSAGSKERERGEEKGQGERRRIPGSGYLARTSRESNAGSPGHVEDGGRSIRVAAKEWARRIPRG